MTPFVVPQLLEKLNLLVRHSSHKNISDIARSFGISEDAVRYWTKETASQRAGTVPKKRVAGLLALFGEALPDQTEDNLIALIQGPIFDLEDAFRLRETLDLSTLLSELANKASGRLIPVERSNLGLVVANRLSRRANCQFPLNKHFRIEFDTKHRGRHTLGLQKSPQAWGCIETAWSSDGRVIHLPGVDEEGELGSMYESADAGVSTFYVVQSTTMFPAAFGNALLDEVPLSRLELSLLAQHLRDANSPEINVLAFSVDFVAFLSSSN